jgi:Cu2+-exporting ATPase
VVDLELAPADSGVAASASCTHCGLDVPPLRRDPARTEQFCCGGCEQVHRTITEAGLGDYYAVRREFIGADEAEPAQHQGGDFEAFERPGFLAEYVRVNEAGVARVEFLLEGVRCAACVWLVEKLPQLLSGVLEARLRLKESQVSVDYDPQQVGPAAIARALDGLGYPPHPAREDAKQALHRAEERRRLVRLGIAGACAGNAMLVSLALYSGSAEYEIASGDLAAEHGALFRWVGLALAWIALLIPGREFFQSAWAALRARTPNLDVPIALALGVGGIAGTLQTVSGTGEAYFDSLTALVFLLLVGRYVQFRQQRWARAAVDRAQAFTVFSCRLVDGDREVEVPVDEVLVGNLIRVGTGEVIAADGVVESGAGSVDEALLSGESEPVRVAPGDLVHAGTRNLGESLFVRVEAVGAHSRVGKVIALVERGLAEKAPIQQLTDRAAIWFVGAVCLAALWTFAVWSQRAGWAVAVEHTVALLIVACPCALGLATPLTLAVAVGRAAKQGFLVKNAGVFESLAKGGELVLDKTGTLTDGAPSLVRWTGDRRWVGHLAALESQSKHPVGRALAAEFANDVPAGARVEDVVERLDGGVSGRVCGVELRVGSPKYLRRHAVDFEEGAGDLAELLALGHTVVGLAVEGRFCGWAALRDQLRPEAAATLERLIELGLAPEVLSGDAPEVVARIEAELGGLLERARGGVDPEGKHAAVRELRRERVPVVMVGDGINDAAALAVADVGISVHGGAEASLVAADVHLSKPGLGGLVPLVELARRTVRTIHLNLALSLLYNASFVVLAAGGHIHPLLAAILMPVSSASVLALALFSLHVRKPRRDRAPRTSSPEALPCP